MNIKVYIGGTILILLCLIKPNLNREYYGPDSAINLPIRLLDLMWGYVKRMRSRVEATTPIRATYEGTPQYELGYLMGEVLERYRKMVGIIKRPIKFKSDAVFDVIKRTELVEHLFLDILHLMYMVHEIKQKYKRKKEFFISKDGHDSNDTFEQLEQERKHREWLRRKKEKEMRKIRNALLKNLKNKTAPNFEIKTTVKRKTWFPIDYGWEINYKWW